MNLKEMTLRFGLDLPEAGQRPGTSKMHQAESFVT
jgi:hypothetical protein